MRRADFLWIVIILGLAWNLGAAQRPTTPTEWVTLEHESGGTYIIRKSAIVGYLIAPEGSVLKSQILLNSQSISTARKYTVEEFEELLGVE